MTPIWSLSYRFYSCAFTHGYIMSNCLSLIGCFYYNCIVIFEEVGIEISWALEHLHSKDACYFTSINGLVDLATGFYNKDLIICYTHHCWLICFDQCLGSIALLLHLYNFLYYLWLVLASYFIFILIPFYLIFTTFLFIFVILALSTIDFWLSLTIKQISNLFVFVWVRSSIALFGSHSSLVILIFFWFSLGA